MCRMDARDEEQCVAAVWGLWRQKQVSQAWINNCIAQYYVGCNYLSRPEIPASGAKVRIFERLMHYSRSDIEWILIMYLIPCESFHRHFIYIDRGNILYYFNIRLCLWFGLPISNGETLHM